MDVDVAPWPGTFPAVKFFKRKRTDFSTFIVCVIYIYTLYRASLDLEKSSKLIETLMDDGWLRIPSLPLVSTNSPKNPSGFSLTKSWDDFLVLPAPGPPGCRCPPFCRCPLWRCAALRWPPWSSRDIASADLRTSWSWSRTVGDGDMSNRKKSASKENRMVSLWIKIFGNLTVHGKPFLWHLPASVRSRPFWGASRGQPPTNCEIKIQVRPKLIRRQQVKGPELFWVFVFPFWDFCWICFSARFPCYLQHFGAGSFHFNCIYNILEFEPFIFHCTCNMLVLKLFMLHGILRLGFI